MFLFQIFVVPVLLAVLLLLVPGRRAVGIAGTTGAWVNVFYLFFLLVPICAGLDHPPSLPSGLALDNVSAAFILLTSVVSTASLSHAQYFFAREAVSAHPPSNGEVKQFYLLTLGFMCAMKCVYLCDNLGFLWISIEATTLLSAGLVYFHRTRDSLEATWKYFIICSVGIAFALLGTVFLFASSQYANPHGTMSIRELTSMASSLNVPLLKLGMIFAFLGYGTKAGVFPLHSWLPDAHSEAPAPASALLSGALLNCALYAIYRFFSISEASGNFPMCRQIILWAGTVTVCAAAIFLVRQHGLKRLWAYSSVENVGLMLVAMVVGSAPLFFLQAVNHSMCKAGLFLLSGNIVQATGSKSLKDIRGLLSVAPGWGVLLCLLAFAVTGAPPFGVFISEWLILTDALKVHEILPVVLLLLALALTFIAVCVHIMPLLCGTGKPFRDHLKPGGGSTVIPLLLLGFSILLGLFVNPAMLTGGLK